MSEQTRRGRAVRTSVVVAVATLLALALPDGSPLYAQVYPSADAKTFNEALAKANLEFGFASPQVTQFETTTFTTTIVYGVEANPELPTVKIAWSNEAALAASEPDTFEIQPTSPSRQDLDSGTSRPEGGYQITWTWDVTPLVAGEHTLTLSILPTVIVEGEVQPGTANINEPISVTIDIHPVKHDFDEVLTAAAAMKTEVPEEMTVGAEHDVTASMSMAGHDATVDADIALTQSDGSADLTIIEVPATPRTAAQSVSTGSGEGAIVRRWTVIPDETGQVALEFTATIEGVAGKKPLKADVPVRVSARSTPRPPSFWNILQQPVLYIAPFVAVAGGVLALWAAWKKRKAAGADADVPLAPSGSGDAPS